MAGSRMNIAVKMISELVSYLYEKYKDTDIKIILFNQETVLFDF